MKQDLNKNSINMSSLGKRSTIRGSSGNKALDTTGFPLSLRSAGMTGESGRTLVESLATLSIVVLLAVGAIKSYHFIVGQTKAQNTAKMIKTLALERQNSGNSASDMTVKGPHSSLKVVNGTPGNHQPYFWVETTLSDKDFCKALKDSGIIQADLIEVDGVANGNCKDNSKIAFYFKKDKGGSAYCPSNATNCDQYGDATGCEEGYYLDNGQCSACPEHVATCEDENTATSCEGGYLLYGGSCVSTSCTVDSDCASVCSSCEDGMCTNECEIPTPDANQDCGENECIIYDENTQTCKNACTRVDYLYTGNDISCSSEAFCSSYRLIDTKETIDLTSALEIRFSYDKNILWSECAVQGDGSGYRSSVYIPAAYSNSNKFGWMVGLNEDQRQKFILDANTHIVKMDLLHKKVIWDGNEYTIQHLNYTPTNTHFGLFSGIDVRGSNGSFSFPMQGKIYYAKFWKDNDLTKDFIPVLAPNNRPAMFDRVEKRLYYNQGTGEFLYGN